MPDPENSLDKQIAATALVYDRIVISGNAADFDRTMVLVSRVIQIT